MKKTKAGNPAKQKAKKKGKPAGKASSAKVLPFGPGKGFAGVPADKKLVLHLGLGTTDRTILNPRFKAPEWFEVKVDPDPKTKATVITDLATLKSIPSAVADAVWLPHLVQRFSAHQVIPFLKQIKRILKPNGEVLLTVPDMVSMARSILDHGLEVPVNNKKNGMAPIDLIFGLRHEIAKGNPMYFHTGFVANTLINALHNSGFWRVRVIREQAVLTAQAYNVLEPTDADKQHKITGEDMNDMMKKRDEIDQPPQRWDNPEI